MDIFKQLLLQLVLILLNAFFAATEIAVISLNEKRVEASAEEGDKKARKMLKILKDPTKFLSTIQLGITLAGFLGSAFAADNFAERLTAAILGAWPNMLAYENAIDTLSVIVITLILSYFTLVLGELVPKRIAMKYAEKVAAAFCGIVCFLTAIFRPITWFLAASTNIVLRLFGIDPNEKEETVSEEDIVLMLDAGGEEGTLSEDNIEYIKNVFKLDNMTAEDVMTPKKSLVFVTEDDDIDTVLNIIEKEGYSRIPVFDKDGEHVVGILQTRDFLLKYHKPKFKLKQAFSEPVLVPELVNLDVLFKDMQTDHTQLVVVVNEYGETAGIVTMEDILEEIVGEIWDERDEEIVEFVKLNDDTYRVLCTATVEDFFEYFEVETDEETEATTVNGWLTEQSGTIPEENYTLDYKNLTITVTKADDFMAHEITVKVLPVLKEDEEED